MLFFFSWKPNSNLPKAIKKKEKTIVNWFLLWVKQNLTKCAVKIDGIQMRFLIRWQIKMHKTKTDYGIRELIIVVCVMATATQQHTFATSKWYQNA